MGNDSVESPHPCRSRLCAKHRRSGDAYRIRILCDLVRFPHWDAYRWCAIPSFRGLVEARGFLWRE